MCKFLVFDKNFRTIVTNIEILKHFKMKMFESANKSIIKKESPSHLTFKIIEFMIVDTIHKTSEIADELHTFVASFCPITFLSNSS